MNALVDLWEKLASPSRDGVWRAVAINAAARLAKTPRGGVALIVSSDGSATPKYPLETVHVIYRPSVALEVETGDGSALRGEFGVLECSAGEPELMRHFLRLVEGVLPSGALDGWAEFDEGVRAVFELFRRLTRQGTRSIIGLWGELLVVANASDPDLMVRAFHSDPEDIHDFVADDAALEVKASSGLLREHHFSLDQLNYRRGRTAIVSVMLSEDPLGLHVFDLRDQIAARLGSPGLRSRLAGIVSESLGDAWKEASRRRFTYRTAVESLQFYSAEDVPSVVTPVPADVHRVRFVASLASVAELPEGSPMAATLVAAARPVGH